MHAACILYVNRDAAKYLRERKKKRHPAAYQCVCITFSRYKEHALKWFPLLSVRVRFQHFIMIVLRASSLNN